MARFLREHGLTIALSGAFYFFGILSARYLLGYPVQDGMATLVGAALGAAITVGGSYWLIGAGESYKSDRFKRLVTDNVRFIADQARTTKAFLERAEENEFQEHSLEEYALQTREQLLALLSSADLLGQSSPFAGESRL